MTPQVNEIWCHRGTGLQRQVLKLLRHYVRMSVPGPRHRGAYIDVPLSRFGEAGPEGYERVSAAPQRAREKGNA